VAVGMHESGLHKTKPASVSQESARHSFSGSIREVESRVQ